MVMILARQRMLQRACLVSTLRVAPLRTIRFNSTGPSTPLGLKDASKMEPLSGNMKLILGYITFGVVAMATIARVKERSEDVEESARVFNMAKRAVVKDRRFFEAIGYPKTFERIDTESEDGAVPSNSDDTPVYGVLEGTFRALGDKGTAIVTYKHRPAELPEGHADGETAEDVPIFEVLQVHLADGSEFSALESYVKNEDVLRQQKASSLGKKLFFPVLFGVFVGGISSFLVIRIVRNRPFYVHKLVLDHVNNSDVARKFLGHPITSNRSEYIGALTDEIANYTVGCKGPKGEGNLIVKAYKKSPVEDPASTTPAAPVMATPGTDWKFSTLVLQIKRNELRKEKDKTAKVVDLLATQNKTPTSA